VHFSSSAQHTIRRHHRRPSPAAITKHIFGARWRTAWCISLYESHHYLHARNGANLGPWQVNVPAHPWADPWRLTHSWWYSARAAYRISGAGRDWSAWTTHGLCGV
jgi:hypothetical protein